MNNQIPSPWSCIEVLLGGWWSLSLTLLLPRPTPAFKKKQKKLRVSLPGWRGRWRQTLTCELNYQLLDCKLIVKDGRPIPAVPSITSHLIIHTDNRPSGLLGSGHAWLIGSRPGLYIMAGLLGDKDTHKKNSSDFVSLERASLGSIRLVISPCHR